MSLAPLAPITLYQENDLHELSHLERLNRTPGCHRVWADWPRHPARPNYPREPGKESRPTLRNFCKFHLQVNRNPLQILDLSGLQKAEQETPLLS